MGRPLFFGKLGQQPLSLIGEDCEGEGQRTAGGGGTRGWVYFWISGRVNRRIMTKRDQRTRSGLQQEDKLGFLTFNSVMGELGEISRKISIADIYLVFNM